MPRIFDDKLIAASIVAVVPPPAWEVLTAVVCGAQERDVMKAEWDTMEAKVKKERAAKLKALDEAAQMREELQDTKQELADLREEAPDVTRGPAFCLHTVNSHVVRMEQREPTSGELARMKQSMWELQVDACFLSTETVNSYHLLQEQKQAMEFRESKMSEQMTKQDELISSLKNQLCAAQVDLNFQDSADKENNETLAMCNAESPSSTEEAVVEIELTPAIVEDLLAEVELEKEELRKENERLRSMLVKLGLKPVEPGKPIQDAQEEQEEPGGLFASMGQSMTALSVLDTSLKLSMNPLQIRKAGVVIQNMKGTAQFMVIARCADRLLPA